MCICFQSPPASLSTQWPVTPGIPDPCKCGLGLLIPDKRWSVVFLLPQFRENHHLQAVKPKPFLLPSESGNSTAHPVLDPAFCRLTARLTRLVSRCLSFSNYETVMAAILSRSKHLVRRCWAGAMRSDQCLRVLVAPPPSLILRHMMSTPSATLGRK